MTTGPVLTRRTVTRDGVQLAVFEGGNPQGPTVVMVHGWPDTHHVWLPLVALLASDFRVVAYDTRGQGESRTSAPDASFTLAELAADFFAVIDAVSPGNRVHVLGHDWGSIQVWEAVCEPGAEDSVASFTSMSGPNLDHMAAWARRNLRHPTPGRVADVVAQAASSSYVPFLVSPFAPAVLRVLGGRERWRRLVRATDGPLPQGQGHGPSLAADLVSGLRYYRANLMPTGHRPRERRTSVPVLQLVLTRDLAVRRAPLTESDRWTGHLERRDLPHGHWAVLTHPAVVADETARFVHDVERRS